MPGTFFVYQIFEVFAIKDTKQDVNYRLNDNWLLLIFSLPYIYDFFVGTVGLVFISRIASFNDTIRAFNKIQRDEERGLLDNKVNLLKEKYSNEDLDQFINDRRNKVVK